MQVSHMAEHLIGSEIIKLAGDIRALVEAGNTIFNFTIGDFDPAQFPIPAELRDEIIKGYERGETNYPAGNGMAPLRKQVSALLQQHLQLDYSPEEVLIFGGARPAIYTIYATLLDPGDKVIYPVPSWNNNHYGHLMRANRVEVEATPENNFMPTAAQLAPLVQDAAMIAVCSPLNPTGTTFSRQQLSEICELVLAENKRRGAGQKPLYLLYDQIYWMLTYGDTQHYNPVTLYPEMRPYTIFVDGISKGFAATGVRVGWAMGPKAIVDKMNAIASHIGAWAPKAEQVATANYLADTAAVETYLTDIRKRASDRLHAFYNGFERLRQAGFAVEAISPQAAIYLTVRIEPQQGMTNSQMHQYLLKEAQLALVPFTAFGAKDSAWYRLSIGTAKMEEIPTVFEKLEAALAKLR